MSGDDGKPSDDPPWRKGVTGVTGVTPPGRRLSSRDEPRPTAWSASGVKGVTPPGRTPLDGKSGRTSPGAKSDHTADRNAVRLRANQRALERRKRARADDTPIRIDHPLAGFVPDIFADVWDPPDLQDFLKLVSDHLDRNPPPDDAVDDIDLLIVQTQAPFELIVGFAIMSALVQKDDGLRQAFGATLERGANAFFNLARRLNPRVRIPPGLNPDKLDALFFGLPDLALQVPYAFATDAFGRIMPLLRDEQDEAYNEQLVAFTLGLRTRFIETRSFGDQPLARLFPSPLPDGADPE